MTAIFMLVQNIKIHFLFQILIIGSKRNEPIEIDNFHNTNKLNSYYFKHFFKILCLPNKFPPY